MGGRRGTSRLSQATWPIPVVTVTKLAQSVGVPTALLALSALPLAVNNCATCRPSASPAVISLRVAVPDLIG